MTLEELCEIADRIVQNANSIIFAINEIDDDFGETPSNDIVDKLLYKPDMSLREYCERAAELYASLFNIQYSTKSLVHAYQTSRLYKFAERGAK